MKVDGRKKICDPLAVQPASSKVNTTVQKDNDSQQKIGCKVIQEIYVVAGNTRN